MGLRPFLEGILTFVFLVIDLDGDLLNDLLFLAVDLVYKRSLRDFGSSLATGLDDAERAREIDCFNLFFCYSSFSLASVALVYLVTLDSF